MFTWHVWFVKDTRHTSSVLWNNNPKKERFECCYEGLVVAEILTRRPYLLLKYLNIDAKAYSNCRKFLMVMVRLSCCREVSMLMRSPSCCRNIWILTGRPLQKDLSKDLLIKLYLAHYRYHLISVCANWWGDPYLENDNTISMVNRLFCELFW